jgi:hypothetical protein
MRKTWRLGDVVPKPAFAAGLGIYADPLLAEGRATATSLEPWQAHRRP